MADVAVDFDVETESALPIEDFISRGNDRAAGRDVPALAPAEGAKADANTDQTTLPPVVAAPTPEPIDRRTREGRKQTIRQEIDELTATKHTTQKELDDARQELGRLRAELSTLTPPRVEPHAPAAAPASVASNGDDPEPQPEQFPSYEKYVKAQARWEARQEFKDQQAALNQRSAQEQAQRITTHRIQTMRSRVDAYRATHPDFDARINPQVAAMPFTTHDAVGTPLGDAIVDSDHAPELLEYFTDHPDDFQRLAALPPMFVFREIGKIEARFGVASHGPTPTPVLVSAATPPTKPLGGSPIVSDTEADDGDDLSEAAILRHMTRENAKDPRLHPAAARR